MPLVVKKNFTTRSRQSLNRVACSALETLKSYFNIRTSLSLLSALDTELATC